MAMNKSLKKAKPFAVTMAVALGGIFLLNTLANRSAIAAKAKATINNGL